MYTGVLREQDYKVEFLIFYECAQQKKKYLLEELRSIERDYFSGLHEEQHRSKQIWKRNPAVNITTKQSHYLPG